MVMAAVGAQDQDVPDIAGVVVGLSIRHQAVAPVIAGVAVEFSHVDPRQIQRVLAVPIPLVAALLVHGDAAGQQHLRAEVHTVTAYVIIGVPCAAALVVVLPHIGLCRLTVIGMVALQRYLHRLLPLELPPLNGPQQLGQPGVRRCPFPVGQAEIGIVVSLVVLDQPALIILCGNQFKDMGHIIHLTVNIRCGSKVHHGGLIGLNVYLSR